MAQNTSPIYTLTPKLGVGTWTSTTTANTKSDGTGTIATDILLLYTAGTNGAYIDKVRLSPSASSAATATTATVARLYLSTITSSGTTRTDTFPFYEQSLPAQTADQTTTGANYFDVPCGFAIPANQTVLFSMHHAAAANTSWQAIVFGGDY